MREHLLLFLLLDTAASVDDDDVLLLRRLFNRTPCLRANGVSNHSRVDRVLSEKWLEIGDVVDNIRLESTRQHVLGFFIGTETARWMDRGATLLAAESGIDTAASPPGRLHTDETV